MLPLATQKTVVVDASVLINLLHLNRLDLLGALPNLRFVLPQEVEAEITRPEQLVLLTTGLAAGHLAIEISTDLPEITLAANLRQILGKGEAACLAMAQHRGWWVACDERGLFAREVESRLGAGRSLNTPGLLVRAIRARLLTVAEADKLKAVLEAHRFRMTFASFGDLA